MIDYLVGRMTTCHEEGGIQERAVEIHGIGYRVLFASGRGPLVPVGQDGTIVRIHEHIESSGQIELYGFRDVHDREFFRALLKAKRVGPKAALRIMAVGDQALEGIARAGVPAPFLAIPRLGEEGARNALKVLRSWFVVKDPPARNGTLDRARPARRK
jgi:holliday junction DNA helicase RuvA